MNLIDVKHKLKTLKRTSFGISIPELRKFAKALAKENYLEFILENTNETFELKLLHAFLIGYINDDIDVVIKYFKDFIPYVNDWAVNDSLCQNFKIARKYQEKVFDFLMQYKHTKKEFESRIISVVLLSHYLNDEYIDRVITVLNELNTDDYYSQMGVAWAFATIAAKYPQKCINYLKSDNCNLNIQTRKKTTQKIKESYRVSEKFKNLIKQI